MVEKYITVKADDLTGDIKDVVGVQFGYAGKNYSLDLGPKNKRKLEKLLEPFIDAATASSTVRAVRASMAHPTTGTASRKKSDGPSLSSQVREWAKQHDIKVPDRGRLPQSVLTKYDEYESNRTVVG